MIIDQIREEISIELQFDESWLEPLDDSVPGHYGVVHWEAVVMPKDIWVDMKTKEFNFKDASIDFTLTMAASKGDDSFEDSFSKNATGKGKWAFAGNDKITITELVVEYDTDLYKEE